MSSSGGEDAPESFSLQDSRRTVKRQAADLRSFQASEREKKRARNRERDTRLKDQAGSSKTSLKDVEERMAKAMRDAEEESVEDRHQERESDRDSDEASDGEDNERVPPNPDHLPDHLFVSAFSNPPASASAESHSPRKRSKKRPRSAQSSKDTVIGSRVIRTLGDPARSFPSAASTVPRRKVTNFIDRSLGLKGKGLKSKGWTRKPANIGVLKTSGPPITFVRPR